MPVKHFCITEDLGEPRDQNNPMLLQSHPNGPISYKNLKQRLVDPWS